MGIIQKWILKRIAQETVVQGGQHQRIVGFYKVLVDAARREFYEDNKPTLDSFLEECHREALGEGSEFIMDNWVTRNVAEAIQRLGFAMLDFSMNDFRDVGFSQQEMASGDKMNDPVFVIDLAIALLKRCKEKSK